MFMSITVICAGLLLVAALAGRRRRRPRASWVWALPVVFLLLALLIGLFTVRGVTTYRDDLHPSRLVNQRVTALQAYVSEGVARTQADVQHLSDVTNRNARPPHNRPPDRVTVFLLIGPAVLVLSLLAVMLSRRSRRSRDLFGPHHSPHRPD